MVAGLTLDQEIELVAVVVGVAGLVLTFVLRSRRVKVKIEIQEDSAVVVNQYLSGERRIEGHMILIYVTNLGDRPITITSVELNGARQKMRKDLALQPSERILLPIEPPDSRTFAEVVTVVLTTSEGKKVKGRGRVRKTDPDSDDVIDYPFNPPP